MADILKKFINKIKYYCLGCTPEWLIFGGVDDNIFVWVRAEIASVLMRTLVMTRIWYKAKMNDISESLNYTV